MSNGHSLSQLLRQQWDSFEKQLLLTRNRTSRKNVHGLRVQTRRLEAIVLLASFLKSTRKCDKILSAIKSLRDSLGPLRDIQVEEMALQELHYKEIKPPKKGATFRSYLLRSKSDAKEKARHGLNEFSLKQQRKKIFQLEKKLQTLETQTEQTKIEKRLDKKVRSSVIDLNKTMPSQYPMPIKKIHRIRILTKQCRYQCEFLKSLTGDSIVDLSTLRQLQSVAGKIQNEKTLIDSLDRFLDKKKNHDNLQALALRKRVREFQSQLLKPKRVRQA